MGEEGLEDASVPVVSLQLAKPRMYGNCKKVNFTCSLDDEWTGNGFQVMVKGWLPQIAYI